MISIKGPGWYGGREGTTYLSNYASHFLKIKTHKTRNCFTTKVSVQIDFEAFSSTGHLHAIALHELRVAPWGKKKGSQAEKRLWLRVNITAPCEVTAKLHGRPVSLESY